jgi:hypothetical protein
MQNMDDPTHQHNIDDHQKECQRRMEKNIPYSLSFNLYPSFHPVLPLYQDIAR